MRFCFYPIVLALTLIYSERLGAQTKNTYGSTEREAIELVNMQLEAYNTRDLDLFISNYSDSVKVFEFPNKLMSYGIEELKNTYAEFFKNSPNLNCQILNRIAMKNIVIDQELVTGHTLDPKDEMRATAIYTVENGKIQTVQFIFPE